MVAVEPWNDIHFGLHWISSLTARHHYHFHQKFSCLRSRLEIGGVLTRTRHSLLIHRETRIYNKNTKFLLPLHVLHCPSFLSVTFCSYTADKNVTLTYQSSSWNLLDNYLIIYIKNKSFEAQAVSGFSVSCSIWPLPSAPNK